MNEPGALGTNSTQILSNFKLFSKTKNSLPHAPSQYTNAFYYKITLFVVSLIIISIFAYLQRDIFSKYLNDIGISSLVEKWWLNAHLTSAGELASTYVPNEFSTFISETASSFIGKRLPLNV